MGLELLLSDGEWEKRTFNIPPANWNRTSLKAREAAGRGVLGNSCSALQCQETSSPPPCLAPSQHPAGPLSNKGKAFPFPSVRWIGLEVPALEQTEINPNWSTHRGEGRGASAEPQSDQVLGFLWPSLDTTASPGRAVSGRPGERNAPEQNVFSPGLHIVFEL